MEIVAEEWRPVTGELAGWPYEVSSLGRVASIRGGKRTILKDKSDRRGYRRISLQLAPTHVTRQVHRLVAMAFIDGYASGLEVNHKNFIKTDNRIGNLEWVTPRQNIDHGIKGGRYRACGLTGSKLTPAEARLARTLMRSRRVAAEFLARWFGCSVEAMRYIRNNPPRADKPSVLSQRGW